MSFQLSNMAEVCELSVIYFTQKFGNCARHGQYPLNMLDADGNVRWIAPPLCPSCLKQERVNKLLSDAEISPKFRDCSFLNYHISNDQQQLVLDHCREYAEKFKENYSLGRCLILRGMPGTGKNHLATSISKSVMVLGYSTLHITTYQLISRIRRSWKSHDETEEEIVNKFIEIDLLILDEVGIQYGSEGEQILLYHVIDGRWRKSKPMILLSNETLQGIKQFLGVGSFDRIMDAGCIIMNFQWGSYRK